MAFRKLFDVALADVKPVGFDSKPKKKHKGKYDPDQRGCGYCPMADVDGIEKIQSKIRGRSILIVVQSPGPEENRAGRELIGDSGKLFWKAMRAAGLEREDCDITSVMRCMPSDWVTGSYNSYLKMRNPSPLELHCCSKHTERMLAKSAPRQILVLGQLAAKQLLRTRSLPGQKTFWSDELKARVYLADHPAFFLRGYGQGPRFQQFEDTLKRVAADSKRLDGSDDAGAETVLTDQFSYLRKQKYRLVTTEAQALEAERLIHKYRRKGYGRCAVDIEDDEFKGKRDVFACGFSPRVGTAFVFVWRHAKVQLPEGDKVFAVAKRLLEDASIDKAMQYGCSDVTKLEQLRGVHVASYTHDTNLSEFLRFSDVKQYGLDATSERRFQEFSGYKLIIIPELLERLGRRWDKENPGKNRPAVFRQPLGDAQDKYVSKQQGRRYSYLSLETLRLYNGADCDLTKRIEKDNQEHVPQALMQLYVDLSFVLSEMEDNGPWFDYQQHALLETLVPLQVAKLRRQLCKMAGDKSYNPGSPQQVMDVMYGENGLGLDYPFDGKPNTRKAAMLMLGREHKFPLLQLEWRGASKVKSTYLDGYIRTANAHGGKLRTKWWATGTRTGRLSAGGGKDKKTATVVNLQNIKKDPHIQNMCAADKDWRRAYGAVTRIVKRYAPDVLRRYTSVYGSLDVLGKAIKKASGSRAKRLAARIDKRKQWLKANAGAIDAAKRFIGKKIEKWLRKNLPNLKTFLILDYGQVEVRVAAQLARDKQLLADCAESDIHTRVGVSMTGWDADRIKNDNATRTLTKNVHFGILFGISKKNLYKFVVAMSPPDMRDRIEEEEVGRQYDNYFARYPGIRRFIDSQREFAREHGYVTTIFGMVQTLNVTADDQGEEDEYIDPDEMDGRKAYWGNQCINGPVQGSAHQLMICALVNIRRKREKYALLGVPPLEVHDALYFGVAVLTLGDAVRSAKYLLEKESLATVKSDFPDIKWKVPIAVDVEAGLLLGGKVPVAEDVQPGVFMFNWWVKVRGQMWDLHGQLRKMQAA